MTQDRRGQCRRWVLHPSLWYELLSVADKQNLCGALGERQKGQRNVDLEDNNTITTSII